MNYTDITPKHRSYNLVFENNTHINSSIFFRNQGGFNLTHKTSEYWYRSFQIPWLNDRDEFYFSNNTNNLTGLSSADTWTTDFQQGLITNWKFNYSVFKKYSYFQNINATNSFDLNIYNLTSVKSGTLTAGTILSYEESTIPLQPLSTVEVRSE